MAEITGLGLAGEIIEVYYWVELLEAPANKEDAFPVHIYTFDSLPLPPSSCLECRCDAWRPSSHLAAVRTQATGFSHKRDGAWVLNDFLRQLTSHECPSLHILHSVSEPL